MKSRSNSAFFILCRAFFLALCSAFFVFVLEVLFLGLRPVLKFQLLNPELWVIPLICAVFVFIWNLSRSGLYHFLLSCLLVFTTGMVSMHSGVELQNVLFRYLRNTKIDLQRYTLLDNPEYPDTYLITSDPVAIYYVDDGNYDETISEETLNYLCDYVRSLPSSLLVMPCAIYFMEDAAFCKLDPSYENSSVYGMSRSSDFTIHIRLIGLEGRYSYTYLHSNEAITLDNPKFYTETIVHELCHLIDMQNVAGGSLLSANEPFLTYYEENPDLFGSYGQTSSTEWFAECGVYYFMYPDELQKISPELYDAFAAAAASVH